MDKLKKELNRIRKYILQKDIRIAFVIAVGFIFLAAFIGWYNNLVVPINVSSVSHYLLEPNNKFKFLSNWDGPDYINIAKHGYQFASQTNFYPIYPILIYLVHFLLKSYLISALAISWLCFWGAVYFYIKLVKTLFNISDVSESLRATMFFLVFPTAMFMVGTYTESLLCLTSLAAIYYALKKNYLAAAVFCAIATGTHLTGVFVAVLVALIALEQRLDKFRIVLYGLLGLSGQLVYMIYLAVKFNQPTAFVTAQKSHGWINSGFSSLIGSINFLSIVMLLLLLTSFIYWWSRKRVLSYYSLLFILIPVIGKDFGGFPRYCLLAFSLPLMFYDYTKDRRMLSQVILIISTVFWTYLMLQYAGGYVGG